jgi:hypothetical protein
MPGDAVPKTDAAVFSPVDHGFLKVTFFVTTKKMIELNKIETSKKIQTNLV